MKLEEILSIGGKPGLYKLIKATRQGVLVESLTDGKRMPVSQRAEVSALSDIAIYTYEEEIPLSEIFDKVYDKAEGGLAIDAKKASNEELKAYMEEILPNFDQERVYPSHLKKLFTWYNMLHAKDMLIQETEDASAEAEESAKEGE
ncbi:MAG: hypothetical protein DA405_04050 [Bacteroidetes bacterium]|nr:MAG: hypothetical protein DA405_04050 [Bacteroidota bacterium]